MRKSSATSIGHFFLLKWQQWDFSAWKWHKDHTLHKHCVCFLVFLTHRCATRVKVRLPSFNLSEQSWGEPMGCGWTLFPGGDGRNVGGADGRPEEEAGAVQVGKWGKMGFWFTSNLCSSFLSLFFALSLFPFFSLLHPSPFVIFNQRTNKLSIDATFTDYKHSGRIPQLFFLGLTWR